MLPYPAFRTRFFRVFSRPPSRRFPSGPHIRPRFLPSCSPRTRAEGAGSGTGLSEPASRPIPFVAGPPGRSLPGPAFPKPPFGTAFAGTGSASLIQAFGPFGARSALHRSGYAVHIESLQAQKQNGNRNGDQDGAGGKAGIPAVDVFFFQHLPQTDGHGILV